jgi:hypothetical protein
MKVRRFRYVVDCEWSEEDDLTIPLEELTKDMAYDALVSGYSVTDLLADQEPEDSGVVEDTELYPVPTVNLEETKKYVQSLKDRFEELRVRINTHPDPTKRAIEPFDNIDQLLVNMLDDILEVYEDDYK